MSRWASRLQLVVTSVRVERVQEIKSSLIDLLAEDTPDNRTMENNWCLEDCFHELWDSIYSKKGLGWNKDPWVWVIDFEVKK